MVVKKGLKIFFFTSSGIPGPLSSRVQRVSSPLPSTLMAILGVALPLRASSEFRRRLRMTRSKRSGSMDVLSLSTLVETSTPAISQRGRKS
ncbi:MAG: hypothetical protein BWY86_01273 [Candidatus Aminicenantes bacterium ADurb.Bin508]|nr:MAG: hypothetical protein BWY86_01273 [Candidatus Aminicenantes bacterium ADurb.Bin508]